MMINDDADGFRQRYDFLWALSRWSSLVAVACKVAQVDEADMERRRRLDPEFDSEWTQCLEYGMNRLKKAVKLVFGIRAYKYMYASEYKDGLLWVVDCDGKVVRNYERRTYKQWKENNFQIADALIKLGTALKELRFCQGCGERYIKNPNQAYCSLKCANSNHVSLYPRDDGDNNLSATA